MSKRYELSHHMLLKPIVDPAPPWIRYWEHFTKEQQRVIIEREIDQRMAEVKFQIESMKAELTNLATMKSMIKGKG